MFIYSNYERSYRGTKTGTKNTLLQDTRAMTLVLHRESSVCHTSVGFGVRIILWLMSFFDLLHLLIYIMYVLEVQIFRSSERAEFRIEDNRLRFKNED